MSTLQARTKTLLAIASAALGALLLIAILPVLGVAAVVLRIAVLAFAFSAIAAGAVAYAVDPRFRIWLAAKLDAQPDYMGLRMRDGLRLDEGHSWSRKLRHDYTIGADDLAQRVLGAVDGVDLPAVGERIERGDTLFGLRHGHRHLRVRAPLSGVVRHSNARLEVSPQLVNRDPYGHGWAVVVHPSQPDQAEELRAGSAAREWFHSEVDRLVRIVVPTPESVMADGGVVVEDLSSSIDDALWTQVRREFFERPIVRSRP